KLNEDILDRAGTTFTRIAGEEILKRTDVLDAKLDDIARQVAEARSGAKVQAAPPLTTSKGAPQGGGADHHRASTHGPLPVIDPPPVLDALYPELAGRFSRRLLLWPCDREEIKSFGGEMDTALSMPGWGNVWTMPIQNRVDMLHTGVNTEIGVRVLGRRQ